MASDSGRRRYLSGTMIEALIQLNHPDYVPKLWHGTLLFWATVFIALFINTVTNKLPPKIETFVLIPHIIGFFAPLILLVHVSALSMISPS